MDKVKGLISESDYVEMSREFTIDRDRFGSVVADGQNSYPKSKKNSGW